MIDFNRGDVFWTRLDPIVGHEIAKTRPCVVLSNSDLNKRRGTVVIVPLTTTPSPPQPPILVATPSADPRSKARIEQIRSVDKSRFLKYAGRLSAADLKAIEQAVAVVLDIR